MSVKQRISSLKGLGTIIMFWLMGGTSRSFSPGDISYHIVPRLECPEGVFLKIENNKPLICANSLAEVKEFFNKNGIPDLPGQKPCQPHCFRCNGKCLAQAA